MSNELISVIVPVYKVEKYLDKCVESIVNQTYKNLEIILVDDGSPDNCPVMCDAWAEKDNRIKVIHKENTGAGASRNIGLKVSTGDFISFVDSDDYIDYNMYQYLYDLMTDDVDITECEYLYTSTLDSNFDDIEEECIIQTFDVEEAMKQHIINGYFQQVIWNKLYRKQVVNGVEFPEGYLIDDEFFTYKVIGNAKKLVHSSKVLYAYVQQDNSLMHIKYSPKRAQAIDAKLNRLEYIKATFPKLENIAAKDLLFSLMYQYQMACNLLDGEEKKNIKEQMIATSKKLQINKSEFGIKDKLWITLALFSFSATCKIRNVLKIGI